MGTQFRLEQIEEALLTRLKAGLPNVNVDKVCSEDLDESGNLIAVPPAVRLLYENTADEPTRDNQRSLYTTTHLFLVFCGTRNLRGPAAEDSDAKKLLSDVRSLLAGVRLLLADEEQSEPVGLAGAERFQFDRNGCWYAAMVTVTAISQFSRGS